MKKITLIILSLISTLCFLVACNANSSDNCNHTFGDWTTLKSATCVEDGELVRICSKCSAEEKTTITKTNVHAVSGTGTCTDTTIVIPSEHNGLPVIAILDGAFKSNQKIVEVIIPDSVLLIEDGAFSYSKKLSKVELGNGVVEIGMAFTGCDSLTTMKIPASTTTINTLAFYLAKNMERIEVNSSNNTYSSLDGILY